MAERPLKQERTLRRLAPGSITVGHHTAEAHLSHHLGRLTRRECNLQPALTSFSEFAVIALQRTLTCNGDS